ncbi:MULTISPECIES: KUP/HAK/KT family potassium transporter [unclassified Mucilaginibacter]|uniref:KUP/HAK/KT family potassium transporter n=1 Tax=unclassified Mucilaginibacter TaxID=2617802 RepID=UPI00095CF213|nr:MULTISPECIES: KUP/HAK/KT family potassium transporter [unclassified Mucilaginibacter]OJW13804.1 MAG: potassium transporter Kup [Mucilaginibacter sp. 44-25]PLW88272.1 MAG: potassium transporter Kup [Mucilaginibacter sp.]HEK21921.1 potassium transporter Kup [Bacteroidota bacterium]
MSSHKDLQRLSAAGLLISLGIIYGDIGTSPLYVFKAIVGLEHSSNSQPLTQALVLGGVSLIFWTLTLQTTLKYVVITLRADNKGEGGIFSLFSLVRRKAKWLIVPAVIGGCALLADGIITPPITISSAIEGLTTYYPNLPTVQIVIAIIAALFIIQQFGTSLVGKAFGPLMFVWFTMMGVLGVAYIVQMPSVVKALNPYYAFELLTSNTYDAFIILGAVFLCTTGAEALYSDLGHCGRDNIRISWIYVKTCLVLNYLGQAVWLLQREGKVIDLSTNNPFYKIMPDWFLIYGIGIATIAAIIASQALISGSFTLIAEAVRLNLWPKVKINYPSEQKGQLYVPSVNWLLCAGCIGVVLLFQHSSKMEAAYGLSITVAMLMTTILVSKFLQRKKVPTYIIGSFFVVYILIEGTFLLGNLVKFVHGGWFTLTIGLLLFVVMWTWHIARKIKNRYVKFIEIDDYFSIIKEMSEDETVPKYASQLVYLTSANFNSEIESKIIYSILQKQPKRADVYWLVHVDVVDEPYKREYEVDFLVPGKLIRIDFKLGFRVEQQINLLFRKVVEDLVKNGEIDITSKYKSLNKHKIVGDFRFVVIEKVMSRSHNLSLYEKAVMYIYGQLKKVSLSEERNFGLDLSFVTVEKVPLMLTSPDTVNITRVKS